MLACAQQWEAHLLAGRRSARCCRRSAPSRSSSQPSDESRSRWCPSKCRSLQSRSNARSGTAENACRAIGALVYPPLVTLEVVELLPPVERQTPRGNRLEHRRLARVVRSGEDDVAGQTERRRLETLEAPDGTRSDHSASLVQASSPPATRCRGRRSPSRRSACARPPRTARSSCRRGGPTPIPRTRP